MVVLRRRLVEIPLVPSLRLRISRADRLMCFYGFAIINGLSSERSRLAADCLWARHRRLHCSSLARVVVFSSRYDFERAIGLVIGNGCHCICR